jgi:hypothetical protein
MSITVNMKILTRPSWTGELPGRGEGRRHGDERHVRAGVAGAAGDVRALLRELVLPGGELFFLLVLLELYIVV